MTESPQTTRTIRTPRKVYLETFGCQMNVLDSQLVTSQLRGLGYGFTDDWRSADVILYNTCSVREHAEQKVYSRIGEVGMLKKERPDIVLGVLGCMSERDGKDMVRRHPQIDLMAGPGELDKVPMLIDNVVKTSLSKRGGMGAVQAALQGNTHRRSGTLAAAEDQLELLDLSRSFSPDEFQGSAYVRITRGCNKFCTYCVVPFTRGAEVHRPPDNIIEECQRLVDAGVVEITLLGQTVNHYHFDHGAMVTLNGVQQPQIGGVVNHKRATHPPERVGFRQRVTTFADLLARIHDEVPDLRRLRFVTNFPRDFGDDILHVMAQRPRICRYLHIPVQSGSDRMLKAMNRGYSVSEYRDLLMRIRRHLPDCEMATDIICGFPGENEEDHQLTADLLRHGRFKNAFIFKYSPRPGTAAYDRLPDDVPEETKRRRNNELLTIQSEVSAQVHAEYVGRMVRVFVESISNHEQKRRDAAAPGSPGTSGGPGGATITLGWEKPEVITQLTGRTGGDLIVMFDGEAAMIGTMVQVRVERAATLALFGRLVNQPVSVA
ncbi:MAG: MiaB/RimO family radical SAM methylthiotransferase [Phycisphaeraceae bacterium]